MTAKKKDVQTQPESRKLILDIQNVSRVYGDGSEIRALDGVDLQVYQGELVTVMGPSGSGKSTLLNIIGALDLPTSGRVVVDGQDLVEIKDKDHFRSKTVGFVFQLHNLIPTLTSRENVEVPMMGLLSAGERRQRSEELLSLVDMADRMDHLPGQLSGGQRQRVAVARALANNPPIILADEPTGSLDTKAGFELMTLLQKINQTQGTTFVVVTHDPAVARMTSRIIVMRDGKISREDIVGSPLEEDLKMWRHSGLGDLIIAKDLDTLKGLDISKREADAIRSVLANPANGK